MQSKTPSTWRDNHRVKSTVTRQQQRHSEGSTVTIRDRVQNCVAQDRLEDLEQTSNSNSCQSLFADSFHEDLLEQRMRLLNAVSEDTEMIRNSLDLCKKISRQLGVRERSLNLSN